MHVKPILGEKPEVRLTVQETRTLSSAVLLLRQLHAVRPDLVEDEGENVCLVLDLTVSAFGTKPKPEK